MRYVKGKKLRTCFTTGACAAAASKAAALMLFTGNKISEVELRWDGNAHIFRTEDCALTDSEASCAVRKDAGDDHDVTDGILIYSRVRLSSRTDPDTLREPRIRIYGGDGVGRVTKPGLDRPVGSPAINSGPLRMIETAVRDSADKTCLFDIDVTISVPGGAELAKKTFNPELGIVGGISILGTTGIVEPMSSRALIETIRAEINVRSNISAEKGHAKTLVMVPGSIGMSFASDVLGIDKDMIIKCGNFMGEALDLCCEAGVSGILIIGNAGKLVKLSGGIFNTHSRESDSRMDIIIRAALRAGAALNVLKQLDNCVTTDAALQVLKRNDMDKSVMDILAERAYHYVSRRIGNGAIQLGIIFISNEGRILAQKGDLEV